MNEVPNPFCEEVPNPFANDPVTPSKSIVERAAERRREEQEKYDRAKKLYNEHQWRGCKEEQDYIDVSRSLDRFPHINGNWRNYMRGIPGWTE